MASFKKSDLKMDGPFEGYAFGDKFKVSVTEVRNQLNKRKEEELTVINIKVKDWEQMTAPLLGNLERHEAAKKDIEDGTNKIDLSIPVFIIQVGLKHERSNIRSQGHMLVDGWTRVIKAMKLGIEEIPCIVLNGDESYHCIQCEGDTIKRPRRRKN